MSSYTSLISSANLSYQTVNVPKKNVLDVTHRLSEPKNMMLPTGADNSKHYRYQYWTLYLIDLLELKKELY